MTRPWARFDDLRAGTSLLCPPPSRIVTAVRDIDVPGALQQVHDATQAGSWAYGFVTYEAAASLGEQLLERSTSPRESTLVWFGLCDEPVRTEAPTAPPEADRPAAPWLADWTDDQHAEAVATVRRAIAAGETYQCNLTDRLRSTIVGDPEHLYARLALAQRGAYNAYWTSAGTSSPAPAPSSSSSGPATGSE